MDRHLETQILGIYTEDCFENSKMSAAADRKELRKTLDKTQDYCLKPLHNLLFSFKNIDGPAAKQNRQFYNKASHYQQRGDVHTGETEQSIIKDIPAVSTSPHKKEISQNHHGQTDDKIENIFSGYCEFIIHYGIILSINNKVHFCSVI